VPLTFSPLPPFQNLRIAIACLLIGSPSARTRDVSGCACQSELGEVWMRKERELIMSYRTILSLATAAALSAACISITSTDALARGGARVGGHHARVGMHHGGVVHRGVYRGTYAHRGNYRGAYWRPGVAAGVGAAALGAAAAAGTYNYNYGYAPTYYDDTGYYQQPYGYYQQPYGYYSPYRNWRQF